MALALLAAGCASGGGELGLAVRMSAEGERVLASMDDLETARLASVAHLERLEELVRVAPDERRVRAMLVTAWARYALLFVEDDLEEARDRGDTPGASYHAVRARNAYERAIHHGREYLDGPSFDAAVSADLLPGVLAARREDDAAALLWMGAAWMGRLRVGTENYRQLAAQAHVGEALLERALALDSARAGGWAHLMLGLWRGRAGGDAERARQHFDQASALLGQRLLLQQVFLVRTAVCQAHDRERWDALLREVLDARDPAPELRIDNAVAKRKAARDIQGSRRAQCVP